MYPGLSMKPLSVVLALIALASNTPALSGALVTSRDPVVVERGRMIAGAQCASCHGIGAADESPFEQAPPFRRIVQRHPMAQLSKTFADGMALGHGNMPPFELTSTETEALLAYLSSLERASLGR